MVVPGMSIGRETEAICIGGSADAGGRTCASTVEGSADVGGEGKPFSVGGGADIFFSASSLVISRFTCPYPDKCVV